MRREQLYAEREVAKGGGWLDDESAQHARMGSRGRRWLLREDCDIDGAARESRVSGIAALFQQLQTWSWYSKRHEELT